MESSSKTIEAIGPSFSLQKFEAARKQAWAMIDKLSAFAEPGMLSENFIELLEDPQFFSEREKWWHPIKVRLGKNTQCSFRDKNLEEPRLKLGDLFFFDIGPVFYGHEADVGQTFCLGDRNFKNPAEEIFKELKEVWKKEKLTGEALYERGVQLASSRNLEFNPKMVGHRLSEFPHGIHHKGSLGTFDQCPLPDRWILEVHLVDKKQEIGYFFEDLL